MIAAELIKYFSADFKTLTVFFRIQNPLGMVTPLDFLDNDRPHI